MDKKVITKFRVANEEGVAELLYLTQTLAREKFTGLIAEEILENYINDNFNEKTLINEMNSLSNQWLVVYQDTKPAGYVRMTSKGKRPESLTSKRAIRIADFGILKEYTDELVWQSLLDKCLSVGKAYEAIWLNEYVESPLLNFFEQADFKRQQETAESDELQVSAIYLVKEN